MRLSQDKNPIILGIILVFTGFLLALIVITRINAADLYDLSQDSPFLISSDYDSSVFGYRIGSGSTSWIREEFGLLYANLNDNNNVSSFTDQITYQVTASDSWSDSYAVKRGGFNSSNFGIVSGSLLTPENGFIFDNSVEEFHLSKNQWVRVFPCPRQLDYGVSQGYYQIYFYDAYKDFMSGSTIDAGRHPVICMCIPQEHYNEFVLTTDSFEYPYQDYKVFYYDYSMSSGGSLIGWVGILPLPFSFEYGYTLAYSDRSVQIRANGNRVKIESMKFADQVPSPTPTVSPTPSVSDIKYIRSYCAYGSFNDYFVNFLVEIEGSGFNDFYLQPSSVTLNRVFSDYNFSSNELLYNCYVSKTGSYGGSWTGGFYGPVLTFYIQLSSLDSVKFWVFDSYSSPSSYSIDQIKASYSSSSMGTSFSKSHSVPFYQVQNLDDGGICLAIVFVGEEYNVLSFYSSNLYFQNTSFLDSSRVDFRSPFDDNMVFYDSLVLRLNADGNSSPDPNISPTPTPTLSPTPSPSPTDPPYVVIVTPEPEASPTPPINIVTSGPMPSWFPPGDPLIPLDPEIQDDVFGNFSGKVSDNAAFGFLGLLMALIPSEAIWFLWFLLFILIVLGIAKVIIHFTGG